MTASDPRINEEVEENGEVDTGKALVTGTDDTTSFNASLDLNPRSIHLLRSGLGRSANSLESSEADTSSSSMVVKEVVEVKEAAEVNTPDRQPRPLEHARERRRVRLAQEEAQRQACMLRNRTDERDHDRAGNCKMCNNKIPESDWSNYRELGWDVHFRSIYDLS